MTRTNSKVIDRAEEECDIAFTRMLDVVESAPLSEMWKAHLLSSVRTYLEATRLCISVTLRGGN